jgi:demethoxyubiquinone hydroxylase (CLK1/Coq7/Cat5 family)
VLTLSAAGGLLSWFGEDVSAAYVAGVKSAIGDYYNDQIREIYEHKPQELALKEVRVVQSSNCLSKT